MNTSKADDFFKTLALSAWAVTSWAITVLICAIFLRVGVWLYVGRDYDADRMRADAIRMGYAEFILDPATGQACWQWKVKP